MVNTALAILKFILDYVKLNMIDVIVLAIVSFGGYKLFTNHLHTLDKKINTHTELFNSINKKIDEILNFNRKLDTRLKIKERICQERHQNNKRRN